MRPELFASQCTRCGRVLANDTEVSDQSLYAVDHHPVVNSSLPASSSPSIAGDGRATPSGLICS